MPVFSLTSPYQPAGDQPKAIEGLVSGLQEGIARQTLLGVTGSGKTFTAANVIQASTYLGYFFVHRRLLCKVKAKKEAFQKSSF